MAWYFFWQETPETDWLLALAADRDRITETKKPAFSTALDCDNDFSAERMSAEQLGEVRYRGDLYFDFDASTLDEVIPQFKRFIVKLEEAGVVLEQCQLYASGGKGFHITVPTACFTLKPNPRGYQYLPAIYKEIANELFVNTLDLRVYTARRGRMWRTAGVKRPNGQHKVPLTVAEAKGITPELYLEATANPRPYFTKAAEPTYSHELGLMFARALDKVSTALKERKKSKVDLNLVKKWEGKAPETLAAIMRGELLAHGIGFQRISLQLSIVAHSLGWDEEQFIDQCEGLIQNHESDGTRYNSPGKRRFELQRMFQYMAENPCYQFSVGGLKSLLDKDVKAPDLTVGEYTPDDVGDAGEEDEAEDFGVTLGMRINRQGIFKHNAEKGLIKCCVIGMENPAELIDPTTHETVGYEVELYVQGRSRGTKKLDMGCFHSRTRFQQFTLMFGASMQGTDNQVSALVEILRSKAMATGRRVLATPREGVNIFVTEGGLNDVAWISPEHIISRLEQPYRFVGQARSPEGTYRSDLFNAPDLEDTPESREFIEKLFDFNHASVVSRMLSWYCGAPLRQFYHKFGGGEFPLLHPYGQAGAGKSQTTSFFNRMYGYQVLPPIVSPGSSDFALQEKCSGSASIPLTIDEYKPRSMGRVRTEQMRALFRAAYNQNSNSKGTLDRSGGNSSVKVLSLEISAPLVYIGEAAEMESAIQERTVPVPLSKSMSDPHSAQFRFLQDKQTEKAYLSSLGKLLVSCAIKLDIDGFKSSLARNAERIQAEVRNSQDTHRVRKNYAILLTNLDFLRGALSTVFGDHFTERVQGMKTFLIENMALLTPAVTSELSKVLSRIAYLSRNEQPGTPLHVEFGKDYTFNLNGVGQVDSVDIKVETCFAKYSRWCQQTGQERLFDTSASLLLALDAYSGTKDKFCIDNEILKDSPFTKVYRLGVEEMSKDGVETFK